MRKLYYVLFLIATLMVIPACDSGDEEDVFGCTDVSAVNFNASANVSDRSCIYRAIVSFYMQRGDIGNVEVFVGNQSIGTLDRFWEGGPPGDCGLVGTVSANVLTGDEFQWQAFSESGLNTGGRVLVTSLCQVVLTF